MVDDVEKGATGTAHACTKMLKNKKLTFSTEEFEQNKTESDQDNF